MIAAWTSRTSTWGSPVSQVMARSASRRASRWTLSMSFWSSRLGDRLVRPLALLAVGRGEALDQLAGDADDDLGRPEAGHLLGLLEGDRAVVDDRRDVGDRARLHVAEALALAPDAADRAVAGLVDLEDERLGELGPDVEGGAGGERLLAVALPDAAPEGHQPSAASAERMAARASGRPSRRAALALGHLGPAAALAVERGAWPPGRGRRRTRRRRRGRRRRSRRAGARRRRGRAR